MIPVGTTITFHCRGEDYKGIVVDDHGTACTVKTTAGDFWVEPRQVFFVFDKNGLGHAFDHPDNPWRDEPPQNPQSRVAPENSPDSRKPVDTDGQCKYDANQRWDAVNSERRG